MYVIFCALKSGMEQIIIVIKCFEMGKLSFPQLSIGYILTVIETRRVASCLFPHYSFETFGI